MLANFISHILIHPVGKIKIEHFQVFDIHWLYRMSRYAIVKADVTDHNDVTKRHGIVTTVWRLSAIEVTALSKNPLSEMKSMQEKESIMDVRDI